MQEQRLIEAEQQVTLAMINMELTAAEMLTTLGLVTYAVIKVGLKGQEEDAARLFYDLLMHKLTEDQQRLNS